MRGTFLHMTPADDQVAPSVETRTEWQQFYDWHAPRYLENPFTHHTVAEIDFILSLFPLPQGAKILDMGCGAGRHSVELAKRGFQVTGLDISEGMLTEARKLAAAANVNVKWIHADGSDWSPSEQYDAAICLCEGAFNMIGYSGDPVTHDLAILKAISAGLKPEAPFVLTALNGFQIIRQLTDGVIEQRSFDPITMIANYEDMWNLPEGRTQMRIRERIYVPSEVASLLYNAGFKVLALYGGTAGEWSRRPLKLDEVEAMYICKKR